MNSLLSFEKAASTLYMQVACHYYAPHRMHHQGRQGCTLMIFSGWLGVWCRLRPTLDRIESDALVIVSRWNTRSPIWMVPVMQQPNSQAAT